MYHHVQVFFLNYYYYLSLSVGGREAEWNRVGESYVCHLEGVVSRGQLGWLSSTVGSGEWAQASGLYGWCFYRQSCLPNLVCYYFFNKTKFCIVAQAILELLVLVHHGSFSYLLGLLVYIPIFGYVCIFESYRYIFF